MPIKLILCPPTGPLDLSPNLVKDYVFFIRAVLEKASAGSFIDLWEKPERFCPSLKNIINPAKQGTIYCIPIFFSNRTNSLAALRIIRQIKPLAKIIVTGPYGNIYYQQFLQEKLADVVIKYDAEFILLKLCSALKAKRTLAAIPNIAFIRNNVIYRGPILLNRDLDSLPFISPYYAGTNISSVYLQTSRGCPFNCNFCDKKHFWGSKVRFRSIDNVIKELTLLHQHYGIKHIAFGDLNFVYSRKRTHDLCRSIVHAKLNIQWSCNTRIDSVDKKTLRLMKLAGCRKIYYGAESGANRILKILGKRQTRNDIIQAVRATRAQGIKAGLHFMVGCPGESKATLNATWSLLKELYPFDVLNMEPFRFAPGSELWQSYCRKRNIDIKDIFYKSEIILNNLNWEHYKRRLPGVKKFFMLAEKDAEVININQLN